MSKNSCVAAEKHGTCVLRMARVNCNFYRTIKRNMKQVLVDIHKKIPYFIEQGMKFSHGQPKLLIMIKLMTSTIILSRRSISFFGVCKAHGKYM